MLAFSSGLRQGEQIASQLDDIEWSCNLLKVCRAFTRDDNGKVMLGETKNKYSTDYQTDREHVEALD